MKKKWISISAIFGSWHKEQFKKWLEEKRELLRKMNLPYHLSQEVSKFCSDGRRATRNKLAFIEEKLKEYKGYIKNPPKVYFTKYKRLGGKK